MTTTLAAEVFTFSEGFDRIFLEELYGGDTRTVEEIFGTSLAQVELSLQLAEIESRSDDPLRLRRVIHHAKPLFGYLGLLSLQDAAQQLEDLCAPGADMAIVRAAFGQLQTLVDDGMVRVRAEQDRLHRHNNRRA